MSNWIDRIQTRGVLRANEPMAKHCSWRAGGVAERYFEPADIEDLQSFFADSPKDEAITWLGLGSNLLVRDGGLLGTVISSGTLKHFALSKSGRAHAEAGVPCAKIAKESARAGFKGAEFMAGIPGTLGGALAMNAGAFGGEIWDLIREVEMIDHDGNRRWRGRDEFEIAYRQVQIPHGEWFVSAVIELAFDEDAPNSAQRIRQLLADRAATQPTGKASCGSVFRNPPDDYAGRLIEQCELKGFSLGACHISEKHANFIINDGGASASDIEGLIELVRDRVKQRFAIDLIAEVRIIGCAADPQVSAT